MPGNGPGTIGYDGVLYEQIEREAREALRKLAWRTKAAGGTLAATHLRLGGVSEEIMSLAEEIGAGMIVLGSRERAGITQEELARRVGLTRTSITNIERGRQKVLVHTLYAISEALNTSPTALLPSAATEGDAELEGRIPGELEPEERDWVRRVLSPPEPERS